MQEEVMIRAVDHVVILVNDLAQAASDYRALGFTVVEGGEHTGGASHNMLVSFADGIYLELIAFRRAIPEHPWWRYQATGEGLIDFALLPSAIGEDLEAARGRGLPLDGPFPGGRLRPDGVQLEWQSGRSPTADLPFFCADVTPRALRVPSGEAHQHPNGAQGVATITIATADVGASASRYEKLLGQPGTPGFQLGSAAIVLSDSSAHAPERLARRGDGPCALTLRVSPGSPTGALDPRLTHGVPIDLV
jgi:catechol 2,3-dioxygenase-like lactoylglutathione lyase family enzyme